MFRDVPGCSRMFHVPDFIDALQKTAPHGDQWNKSAVKLKFPDLSIWKTNLLRGLKENEEGLFFKPKYPANIL